MQLNGQGDIVKYPNKNLDKSLKLSDFDFRFSTMNFVQQSESILILGSEWVSPRFELSESEENS
ncbi:hypothetical protein U2444_14655, partial [Listeria monocytogenes]|uniref:hypothetical protein n=1 Tax=Listeria monocytogenes TaxID=1639 RepID=UPI002FDC23E8